MKRIAHNTTLASNSVQWYIVCGIVAACLVVIGGVSACAYRCYQQRRRRRSLSHADAIVCRSGSGGVISPTGSTGSGKTLMKRDQSGGFGGHADQAGSGRSKSPSMTGPASRQQQDRKGVDKPSSLQYGPPGAINCHGKIVQTQCYVTNEKEKLVRSPEMPSTGDEKQETSREKTSDDSDEESRGQLGTLEFTVGYDKERSTLIVSVMRAKDLPVKNANIGSSDPYVKLQLLPDKRQKVKTRVLRKTLNPLFEETFTFYGIDENQLSGITLHFVVLSFDRFSRDDIIGEVVYQLDELDPDSSKKSVLNVRRQIMPRQIQMMTQGRGDLLVSICHHPAASRLTVVVLKARNLPKMDLTGLADPYVKIYLNFNGQRIAKKKTHIKKRTLNPVFNESFIFDLPSSSSSGAADALVSNGSSMPRGVLAGISLELVVLDWDQMTKNEVIGRLEIGTNSGDAESSHWAEVISFPRKQIANWHELKD